MVQQCEEQTGYASLCNNGYFCCGTEYCCRQGNALCQEGICVRNTVAKVTEEDNKITFIIIVVLTIVFFLVLVVIVIKIIRNRKTEKVAYAKIPQHPRNKPNQPRNGYNYGWPDNLMISNFRDDSVIHQKENQEPQEFNKFSHYYDQIDVNFQQNQMIGKNNQDNGKISPYQNIDLSQERSNSDTNRFYDSVKSSSRKPLQQLAVVYTQNLPKIDEQDIDQN